MADPSSCPPLTRASVQAAHELIKPHIHHTPTLTNATLTRLASTAREAGQLVGTAWEGRRPARPVMRLYFKCENMQRVGAFKFRGATHAVLRLKGEDGWDASRGVATHSSGNHAQALALAARQQGVPAYIVMPDISPAPKIAGTRGYGARVTFCGSTSGEREEAAARVVAETGARLVPPYDHPDIILGQGTLGLELLEDAGGMIRRGGGSRCSFEAAGAKGIKGGEEEEEGKGGKGLDAIVAPCGGGGMLSGVALSAEGTGTRVFGAEPSFEGADDAKRGFESGTRVEAVRSLTIADGLRTPLGRHPWSVIYERKLVGGFYSVTEREITDALRLVYERMKLVVEPSAAVPLAVALYNEDFRAMVEREGGEAGWDVGIVFSGGNVSLEALGKLFAAGEGTT